LPVERVRAVHLAGGRRIAGRILDDHVHDVPAPVYDLLVELAARAPQPLTVILERDGAYPPFEQLLAQLERARAALKEGRERRSAREPFEFAPMLPRSGPSDPRLQALLAELFVDAGARAHFLADPRGSSLRAGLDPETAARLEGIDRVGLELASRSFARKRTHTTAHTAS